MGISQVGNIERYHPCQERGVVKHHDPLIKRYFQGETGNVAFGRAWAP